MKKYRYKTGIINIIGFVGVLWLAFLFIRILLDERFSAGMWLLVFLGIVFAAKAIIFIYTTLTTYLKPRYIIVDEDKVSIPDIYSFSDDHLFSYEQITHLQILQHWRGGGTYICIRVYIE